MGLAAQSWSQPGERAQGMAGAFVAVADDSSAVYWNPAGLPTGSTFDAQVGVTRSKPIPAADAENNTFLGISTPMLGFAYYRLRSGVSASGDRQNEGSGEVRVSALDSRNFGVSLAQSIGKMAVVGSTLRIVNGVEKTAFDLDLGAMASVGKVRLGMTARNLRESLETDRQVRVGVALVPRALPTGVLGPFTVALDVDLTRPAATTGEERQAALGSEQWWHKGLVGTRLGVRWNTAGDAKPAWAGGLTIKLPHSLFAEGHLTKERHDASSNWGVGARVTF
jgi:hypothetical protein